MYATQSLYGRLLRSETSSLANLVVQFRSVLDTFDNVSQEELSFGRKKSVDLSLVIGLYVGHTSIVTGSVSLVELGEANRLCVSED
jgi:hypothetical protein